MFEIGATLREARERRGVTLEDGEEATRIRARYLAALESERFGELPGGAYARSFLLEYAEFLGLDAERLAAEYDLRFARSEPSYVEPVSFRRRRAWRPILVALAVVVVCAVTVLAVVVPGGGGKQASPKPKPARHIVRPTPAPKPMPRPRPTVAHLRLLAARGDCWLEIHAGSERGPLLYEGILSRGNSLALARRFLWIRIGAPPALDVRMDGKLLPLVPTASPVNVQFSLRRLRVVA